jgi:hypothetical protein
MKSAIVAIVVLSIATSAFAADPPAKKDDLQPVFNGKDLTGWKAPDPNPWWRVENGILIGENDEKLRGHTIYTDKNYQDVIIEGDFRYDGEVDSGVMLRKPEMQVQIGVSRSLKKDMTGSIYKRGYPGQAQGVEKLLKVGDWNTMRIQAVGPKYTVWLNGQQVLEYTDATSPNPGPIGLQIHGGLKMKIEFRNLRAKALNDVPQTAQK